MIDIEKNTNSELKILSVSDNKDSLYSGMNAVFGETKKILDGMNLHERISIVDLTDKVAAAVKKPSGQVKNLINIFLKDSKEATIEKGRGGGVYKGGKRKRVDMRRRCDTCHQVIRPELFTLMSMIVD